MAADVIEIYVGKDNQLFRVPKDRLCKKVKVFAEKLGNSSGNTVVEMPDDDPLAFDVMLQWVLTGKLRPLMKESKPFPLRHWHEMRAYALAEKLGIPELQDAIISTAIKSWKEHDEFPAPESIREGYQKCKPNSPMRRFGLRAFHWMVMKNITTPTRLTETLISNKDLAMDMLGRVHRGTVATNPVLDDPSEYFCKKSVTFKT